ncbi:MAG: hypothetical protein M4579_001359 [Chaenotheca gracillima]|nr:MAG: hypothetical protein M4579_001359 [Chaenotheca gracillima]
MRRVVVTGLGAVTPLGVGVRQTWSRLIKGGCGVVSTKPRGPRFETLPSQVAGLVPKDVENEDGGWRSSDWIKPKDERKFPLFTQYAIAASEQALRDAEWSPKSNEDQEMTGVCLGSGIGSLDDAYDTSVAFEKGELEHAKARGARIYAEISGYGTAGEAYHMTAPRESGEGALSAMKRALKNAQITPSAIDYINAHATSTKIGDAAENTAIKRLMLAVDGRRNASEVNVSSTKGAIGHLLGAAGAVEAIFTIMAIREGVLPPTLNLENLSEPAGDFDCNYVPLTAQERTVDVALSNSFGFGGTSASLCFTRYKN